jgi:hypothetical protein
MREFKGMNYTDARMGIDDGEFAWLENAMTVGKGLVTILPYVGPTVATLSQGIASMTGVVLNGNPVLIVVGSDGSLSQVTPAGTVTVIAAAGTVSTSAKVTMWQSSPVLIIDPTYGYFTWDGTTFTHQNDTIVSVTVNNGGTGYTGVPSVGFTGGGGSGAAATAIVGVGAATLVAAGTGYEVNDVLTIVGGTFTKPCTLTVTSIGTGGTITGFSINTGGNYTVVPTGTLNVTGGFGSSATFTVVGSVLSITVTNPGHNYTSAPAVGFTGGAGSGTTATAVVSNAPTSANSIGVYAGRVWTSKGRVRQFSAAGSYVDFAPADGGGSSVLTDSAFPGNITCILSALDQLWEFGQGAVNAISNVQVPTGATQPTYSDTNIVASIGTMNPSSVINFFRAMAFMSGAGVYSLIGVTPQKLSDKLDRLFPLLTLTPDTPAALIFLNQLPVLCFLVTYNDPVKGARPLLLCYTQGKWFTASQGNLKWITSLLVNAAYQGWGTDGNNIYQLFGASATTPTPYTISSKLWDFGSAVTSKEIFKFMLEFTAPNPINPTVTIDTGSGGSGVPITLSSVVTWINNVRQAVSWTNLSGGTVQWITGGLAQAFSAAEMQGNYLGWTITGTDPPWSFSAAAMEIEPRREW